MKICHNSFQLYRNHEEESTPMNSLMSLMAGVMASVALAGMCVTASAAETASSTESSQLEVEEITVDQPSNAEKAAELWQQTKTKTGEAASSAAELGKVQGGRAVDATKKGFSQGKDAVVSGSKQAWESTKEASGKVADYTVSTAKKVKKAVSSAVSSGTGAAPVTDRSPTSEESN